MDERLEKYIKKSKRIVFFGGAGTSTESGIPDFRSEQGLYNRKSDVPPETILSRDYFFEHTKEFFEYYRGNMFYPGAMPNPAHYKLAELEEQGRLIMVITQNIDGMHQKAGSKKVCELHGSIHRNYCLDCGKFYSAEKIIGEKGIPLCTCLGIIKPDVVLYGELLDDAVFKASVKALKSADLLIVGGTSLSVYPAAGLLRYFRGDDMVIINRSATDYDSDAGLLINKPIGEVFC